MTSVGVKGLPITQERVGAVRWEVECLPTAPVSSEEEEDEDGHAAVQGVAGKVNEPLEGSGDESRLVSPVEDSVCRRRLSHLDGLSLLRRHRRGLQHSANTGIEGDRMSASDVSSVPIVTNQSHPSSQISACTDPESSAAPSRARRASPPPPPPLSISMSHPPARGPSRPAGSLPHPQGLQGSHLNLS